MNHAKCFHHSQSSPVRVIKLWACRVWCRQTSLEHNYGAHLLGAQEILMSQIHISKILKGIGSNFSILGHEAVAEIIESKRRDESVKVGDRVTFSIINSCGNCTNCSLNLPQKCKSLAKVKGTVVSNRHLKKKWIIFCFSE